jgi:phytanoyl-CoA hydroxylase
MPVQETEVWELRKQSALTAEEMRQFNEEGYVRLGRVATEPEIAALCERIDDIMLGKVKYEGMQMQLCPSFAQESQTTKFTHGYKQSTLKYRKIQDLEEDPLFRAYMQLPAFRAITRQLIGERVAVFRAMFMNKPSGGGTRLRWHQDGACYQDLTSGWDMTIPPRVTIWTALDATTRDNGCLQIIPGTHHGILSATGKDRLTDEETARFCTPDKIVWLEMERGEVVLLHNWTLHSSDPNRTPHPRRAFSVCYLDAATQQLSTGRSFPQIYPHYVPVKDKVLSEEKY